ncbi:MAG TPA: NAD(P)/FAD-dependent oxidoreductase [Polyangiaceae bacterium]|nr:NAD(P)/FAD-dependent oxidoreductase [Polyangiaceae bacterium]
MRIESRDVVVLGGGPAGSTFAAIAKKYAPGLQVTVLEKERFPRYHIGESTIPAANPVFRDLEVQEKLQKTFVRKMGITFIWGRDRTPWDADYLKLGHIGEAGGTVINVLGQDFSKLLRKPAERDETFSAVNVRRAEFDKILLDQARAFGADVREGTRATSVRRGPAGEVEAVEWENDAGNSGVIQTPFVLDATGLQALMTRGKRERDPAMNNFAVYGYLANAGWKVMYSGTRDRSNVFLASVEKGWIWYFPIGDDLMSVGAVTNTAHFRDRLKDVDLETFFWEMLRSCPEVADLVKDARLRDDFLPDGKRVACSRDWSSWASEPQGDGWAAVGDAAVFVDPILSSGVTLAMQSAHRAAYTFNTARARPDLNTKSLWRAHADYMRGEAGAFLRLARFFYGNNRAAESWWWEAQRIVNASGRLEVDSKQAFTMATAGFFPTLRAISPDTVVPLVAGALGIEGDIFNVFHEEGLPPAPELADFGIQTLTPFRLDLRTEPELVEGKPTGKLEVYYDLVPDRFDFAHRIASAPARIAPAMAPVADAIGRHTSVRALADEAPSLLPAGFAPEEAIRRSALQMVRTAALKGLVRLHKDASP